MDCLACSQWIVLFCNPALRWPTQQTLTFIPASPRLHTYTHTHTQVLRADAGRDPYGSPRRALFDYY